jgi:DNA-binding LacI/PurR family transcriptional regulator
VSTVASQPNGQERVVITDVARRAGVSYQTVSRVVNVSGPVRASTRARVEEAIEHLGWEPDDAAQRLARRRSARAPTI